MKLSLQSFYAYLPAAARRLSEAARYALLAGAGWLLCVLLLRLGDSEGVLILVGGFLLGHGLLLHGYGYYALLPRLAHRTPGFLSFLFRFLGLLAVSAVVLFVVLLALTGDAELTGVFTLVNTPLQLLVTGSVTWLTYQRQARRQRQVTGLETQLEHSAASLDFLRAQINPHFLFNALNALYGLALQENSERTAEGVQMLGDMMRFMLHENQQPRIQLTREVEYLRNYLALQRLRTAASSYITITVELPEEWPDYSIAPMLLIPFVENAFKHGLSLQHKSWIIIRLGHEQGVLHFKVNNSVHARTASAVVPEASGVGLENVRQRLRLLYPNRHELLMEQTSAAYRIELTLQLGSGPAAS